jgi:SNF2 family DNA or RNA helicase
MEDPPGSPTVNAEPREHSDDAPALNTGEIINLISDNVDETAAPTNVRTLGSPFEERQQEDSVNLGPSMLSTKPKPAKPSEKDVRAKRERLQAMVAAKQRDTTQKHREAGQAAQAAQSTQRTPLVNRSELFVTESNPATPDPAEIFQALQREIEEKRQSGALTTVEEIEFMRAEADERERLYKKSLDANYDRSADEVSEGAPSESFAIPDLEDDDQYAAPKKGGRKRKAETSSKPQPKKRRAAREDAEDILDIARRKQAAKVKAKATKGKTKASEKKAPTKRAPKKKYTGPEMFNAENLLNGTDIFEAAARNIDMPDQPMHDPTGRKATALKQMIASMPQDSQKIASTDAKVLDKALKSFTGQGSCHPAPDGNWELKGLAVTLKSYQVLGVAFMRQREHSSVGPAGGILGDEMGLGKTVEMLANIINGKSLHTAKCHTTLIVASTALVGQWHREIRDKLVSRFEDKRNGVGRVKEYHAHAQIKGNEGLQELMDCDIVLTTYAQVNKEYPNAEIPPELVTAEQKLKWWKEYYEEHKGILFRAKFHRVVLDEAHVIKNHRSLTSRSCSALEAKFRWSISGTIVLNNLNEFFSQFRFLKVPYCDSYKLFRANFTDENDKDGMAKLRQFLNQFMIRFLILHDYIKNYN